MLVLALTVAMSYTAWSLGEAFFERNRARTYTRLIKQAIAYTRISAIFTGQEVSFCHNPQSSGCRQQGELPAVVAKSGVVLRRLPPIFPRDRLYFKISGSDRHHPVTFRPNGLLDGHSGSFFYCPNGRSRHALAIIFNRAGRVRIASVDAQGKKINCSP